MIKIDLTATYGDDDYKVTYERKGNTLIQTCDDDGDIDVFKFEIKNVILENENVIIMKHNSEFKDSSEYELVICDDVNQQLEIAQKNI